jgi:uncharacterized protein (DUF362 family)
MAVTEVFVAADDDRATGANQVIDDIGLPDVKGTTVLIKPNMNTADPAPASTHLDTLKTVVKLLKDAKAKRILVGDRSGPVDTRQVFADKGVFDLARKMGFECLPFDELKRYRRVDVFKGHWKNGFLFAEPVLEADVVIGLCCLKTHQYGALFSMSLKLAVGCLADENMNELHASKDMGAMIAEANVAYKPDLIVMDAVESFYEGGPMTGKRWTPNLTFASKDRIAMDAAGVATLRLHGTTEELMNTDIFDLPQIRRAVELGLGVRDPVDVHVHSTMEESDEAADDITNAVRGVIDPEHCFAHGPEPGCD